MDNEIPLLVLNIFVARTWRFLLCIETEPFFSICDLSTSNLVQQSIMLFFNLPCFLSFRSAIWSKNNLFLFFVYVTTANNTDFIYLAFIHYESKKVIREINTFTFLITAFKLNTAFKLPLNLH